MKFEKFRYWIASKILGGLILSPMDREKEKQQWIKDHLDEGNTLTLTYVVTERPSVH